MELQIVVEPVSGNGYRAASSVLSLSAEGETAEQAVEHLKGMLTARLAAGAKLLSLTLPGQDPWSMIAGIYKDDPYYDEWRQAMADYRQQVENDPDYL